MGTFLIANKVLLPEMLVFLMSLLTLMAGVFLPTRMRESSALVFAQTALWGAIALAFWGMLAGTVTLFSGTVVVDHLAFTLKVLSYVTASGVCFYAHAYLKAMKMPVLEFYVLTLLSVLGLSALLSANHFITLFVGLELMSMPLYAMIALRRHRSDCLEAALKYFVIGAMATGILLYGIALLYGATHTLGFPDVANAIPVAMHGHHLLMSFALVFITIGIAFKLGIVPCHMWLPDVYEGAPTIMTMMVATLAKIAALGMLLRLLVSVMPALFAEWQPLLMVLVVLSLFVGNVTAVKQANLKRLLAYSSIAQLSYLLLGVFTGTTAGYSAAMFYLATYVLTTLAAFALIMCFRREDGEEAVDIADYAGLFQHHPWHAVMFAIVMFSLAGMPPFVGFIAKLQIFQALLQTGPFWLVIYALLLTVVAAYYYIAVVKVMFFDESQTPLRKVSLGLGNGLLTLNALGVVMLGVQPSGLLTWLSL